MLVRHCIGDVLELAFVYHLSQVVVIIVYRRETGGGAHRFKEDVIRPICSVSEAAMPTFLQVRSAQSAGAKTIATAGCYGDEAAKGAA